jgi:curved DNA-binding protein
MTADAPLTPERAFALLGLSPDAAPHDVIGAFRAAAKAAHPDRPGGDAARFRQILEAYRFLQMPVAASAAPAARLAVVEAHVEIAPMLSFLGGEAEAVMSDGRRLRLRIPPGARHGERLTVGAEQVSVRIAADAALQVRGSDLWVTAEVAASLLVYGGRTSVQTPLGERVLWISRKVAERGLIRLEGQGLPARGQHPQGSLYIRLVPDIGAAESPARAQLRKFAAAWAA